MAINTIQTCVFDGPLGCREKVAQSKFCLIFLKKAQFPSGFLLGANDSLGFELKQIGSPSGMSLTVKGSLLSD